MSLTHIPPASEYTKNIVYTQIEEILESSTREIMHYVPRLIRVGRYKEAFEASERVYGCGVTREDISKRLCETFYILCCRDRGEARVVAEIFGNEYGLAKMYGIYTGENIATFKSNKRERVE